MCGDEDFFTPAGYYWDQRGNKWEATPTESVREPVAVGAGSDAPKGERPPVTRVWSSSFARAWNWAKDRSHSRTPVSV